MPFFGHRFLESLLFVLGCAFVRVSATDLSISHSVMDKADPQSFFGGLDHEAYLTWVEERGSSLFDHSMWIASTSNPSQEGAAMHWTIDADANTIDLAIAARATGWVGFGISENGGMRGADMVLFRAEAPNNVTDAYVTDQLVAPFVDTCQSWDFVYSQTNDGFLIFEARRLLDTGDPQDRKIINDSNQLVQPHRVISAWGDETTWEYHGTNRAKTVVRFFGDGQDELVAFRKKMEQEAEGSFFVGAENFLIPNQETTYKDFCFDAEFLLRQGVPLSTTSGLHVIGVEPHIDNRTTKFVHHFVANSGSGIEYDQTTGECSLPQLGREQIYGWAPGSLPFDPPSNLGYPFGTDGLAAVNIQIHYNNPWMEEGHLDSSGITVYWTSKKRQHDIGNLPLGDPMIRLDGTMVGTGGVSRHSFSCPSSCMQLSLDGLDAPITVYGASFHMHKSGSRAYTKVVRNSRVVQSLDVDFFDYDQAGVHTIQQERTYTLLPGDSFETMFYFNNTDNPGQAFGLSSQDEMAISRLLYYPRHTALANGRIQIVCAYGIPFPQCAPDYNSEVLPDSDDMERSFGKPLLMSPDKLSDEDPVICRKPSTNDISRDGVEQVASTSESAGLTVQARTILNVGLSVTVAIHAFLMI